MPSLLVSMPSRAYTSFLREYTVLAAGIPLLSFNALSGLYLISTRMCGSGTICLHGVSMPSRAYISFLLEYRVSSKLLTRNFNALSGLYLISTVPLQKPRFYAVSRTCFCRYLSEYSDNSRFSCMLTFWTYLMRCTYP